MKSNCGFGLTGMKSRLLLCASALCIGALVSHEADAGSPPPPPPSVVQAITSQAAGALAPEAPAANNGDGSSVKTVPIDATPTPAETVTPATQQSTVLERPAANDDSSKLAAEVPDKSIAVPATKWLDQDVGPIASKPVDPKVRPLDNIAPVSAGVLPEQPAAVVQPAPEPARQIDQAGKSGQNVSATAAVDTNQANPVSDAPGIDAKPTPQTSSTAPVQVGITPDAESTATKPTPASDQATAAANSSQEKLKQAEPKLVVIDADYTAMAKKDDQSQDQVVMKGPSALNDEQTGAKFALVWVDGSQRSGDTFDKFWKPGKQFFQTGKDCLIWARHEGDAGRAISPDGTQPADLQAICLSLDGGNEFWLWRKRSGAFSRSALMPSQWELFKQVVGDWSVTTKTAYSEFPVPPYAGQ